MYVRNLSEILDAKEKKTECSATICQYHANYWRKSRVAWDMYLFTEPRNERRSLNRHLFIL